MNDVRINKNKEIMIIKKVNGGYDVAMNVEYAGQELSTLPIGYINKKSCGVGFTTVVIENKEPVIIAMPSIELVKNKAVQYPNERFNGTLLGVWSDITDEDIATYVEDCKATKQPIKLMITHDSLHRVSHLLNEVEGCKLVIDESDRLLAYSHMKIKGRKSFYDTDVTTQVLEIAKEHIDKVSFISATPTPLHYLPEWVSSLDHYTYNWEGTISVKPLLMQRQFPFKALKEEILFPMVQNGTAKIGDRTFSKVIVFVNSVAQIAKLVKESGLDKDDVRVICADSLDNDAKIKGFLRLTDPNNLTKYTFITSSGWQGIDLYDEEAMNIIVSSTTANHTMVDMTTDLKQATSRNRCKTNPNYDAYVYIYNQTAFDKSEEDLIAIMDETRDTMQNNINVINRCITGTEQEAVIKTMFSNKEFKMYVKQDKDTIVLNRNGEVQKIKVTFNEIAFESDKYFILETRKQYQKGFEVVSRLGGTFSKSDMVIASPSYKACCNWFKSHIQANGSIEWQTTAMANSDHADFITEYYNTFNKVDDNISRAKQELNAYKKSDITYIYVRIKGLFNRGGKYSVKDIKASLNALYEEVGLNRKAKWQDLQEAGIELKNVKIKGDNYKEIIKK